MNRRAVILGAIAMATPDGVRASDNPSDSEQVLRSYVDAVLNARDLSAVDRLVSPDFVPIYPENPPGIDALKARLAVGFEAFPELVYRLAVVIAQEGDAMGHGEITGTRDGSAFTVQWAVHVTVTEEKIVSAWMLTGEP